MKLSGVNALSATGFCQFSAIAEHNSWVAERAAKARPYADRSAMIRAFQQAILDATPTERLESLRGIQIAGRAAMADDMTQESKSEQAGSRTRPAYIRGVRTLHDPERGLPCAGFEMPFILAVRTQAPNPRRVREPGRRTLDEELLHRYRAGSANCTDSGSRTASTPARAETDLIASGRRSSSLIEHASLSANRNPLGGMMLQPPPRRRSADPDGLAGLRRLSCGIGQQSGRAGRLRRRALGLCLT